jgi:hypothetical protein
VKLPGPESVEEGLVGNMLAADSAENIAPDDDEMVRRIQVVKRGVLSIYKRERISLRICSARSASLVFPIAFALAANAIRPP